MHQRVVLIRVDHAPVLRQGRHVQPIGHAKSWRHFSQERDHQFLPAAKPGIQRRRRQHQALDGPRFERHKPRCHQAAQAVPQQNERAALVHAGAGSGHNVGQVYQQAPVGGQAAAHATRFPMSVLVVSAHGKAPLV